jgi:hypothetical protein
MNTVESRDVAVVMVNSLHDAGTDWKRLCGDDQGQEDEVG